MYYVYVLCERSGKRYIGYTKDLRKRIKEHQTGKVQSTKTGEWELVYYEAYKSDKDARKRESKLKLDGRSKYHLMNRIEDSLNR